MTTVFARCRNRGWLMALGLAIFAFAPGIASAQDLDPATLHMGGPGSFSTSPVQIPNTGLVTVTQVPEGETTTPLDSLYQVIVGIPNLTGTSAQSTNLLLTDVNGTDLTTSITGVFGGVLDKAGTQGSDAYDVLHLGKQTTDSNNWTNWSGAEKDILGITVNDTGGFSLFTYSITGNSQAVSLSKLARFGGNQTDEFSFANLAVGTFVIAYGFDTSSNKAYSVPFTHAGLIVPEPSTMAIAGLGALGFVGYGLRRRLKK